MTIARQIAPLVALVVLGGLAALGKIDVQVVVAFIGGLFVPSPSLATAAKDGAS